MALAKTNLNPDEQVRAMLAYNDQIAAGTGMETTTGSLEDNLHSIISQINRLMNGTVGGNSWTQDTVAPTALDPGTKRGVNSVNNDLHLIERKRILKRVSMVGVDVSIASAGDRYVILALADIPSTTTAAVGAVTTNGAVVADASGSFGTAQTTAVTGANALQPKNLLILTDNATGDVVTRGSDGRQIYGLLQSENATDGFTITGTTPNRVQISFVVHNASNDGLDLIASGDMNGITFDYAYVRRDAFEDCPEEAWLGDGFADTGVATTTRQSGYDNQGTAAVVTTSNATLDVGTGFTWEIGDAASAGVFTVTEGSAGGTTDVTVGTAVDTYNNNAIDVNFDNGVTVDNGSNAINLGITADQIDFTSNGTLTASSASTVTVTADSANATLSTTTSGNVVVSSAGDVLVSSGGAGTTGGEIDLTAGAGTTTGGAIDINGGAGGTTGAGGSVSIDGGAGGSTSGDGGDVSINSGSVTSGTAGNILIGTTTSNFIFIGHDPIGTGYVADGFALGAVGTSQVSVSSGGLSLLSATAGANTSPITITAGDSASGAGSGNNVDITAGSAQSSGSAGVVTVTAGDYAGGVEPTGGVAALTVTTGNTGWTNSSPVIEMVNNFGGADQAVQLRVGTVDPSSTGVQSDLGSLFHRATGTPAGELYLKTGTGDTNWERVAVLSDVTLQQAYVGGNTIVTNATEGAFDVSGTEAISLDAGAASNFTTTGGNLTLSATAGNGILSGLNANITSLGAAAAGDVNITAGTSSGATNPGGDVFVTAGDGNTTGAGGTITGTAGDGGATGNGGTVSWTAGAGGSTSGNGGALTLAAGTATTDGNGGSTSLTAGDAAGTGNTGGSLTITAGGGGATSGSGGIMTITGGSGGTTSGPAGRVDISGGASTDSTGGGVNINGGDSTTNGAGSVTIAGGDGGTTGGLVRIEAGDGTTPGSVTVRTAATANFDETDVVLNLHNQGTGTGGGSSIGMFVVESDPSSVGVTANVGSIAFRNAGGSNTAGSGYLKTGSGDTDWTLLAVGGATALQTAYDAGNTITATTAGGTIAFSGTADDTVTPFSVTAGNHTVTTAGNIATFTSDANSSGSVISVVNPSTDSGTGLNIDSTGDGVSLNIQHTSTANALVVTDGVTNHMIIGADGSATFNPDSTADFTVNVTGAAGNIDLNSAAGAVTIDAAAASNFTTTSGGLTLSSTGTGNTVVSSDDVAVLGSADATATAVAAVVTEGVSAADASLTGLFDGLAGSTNSADIVMASGSVSGGLAQSGQVSIFSGSSASANTSGTVSVTSGSNTSTGGTGAVTVGTGNSTGGTSGAVTLSSGTAAAALGTSGTVTVATGDNSSGSTGSMGISTGDSTTAAAGNIAIAGGASAASGESATVGSVTVTGGSNSGTDRAGDVVVTGGTNSNASGSGGDVSITGGSNSSTGSGGDVFITAGDTTGTGYGSTYISTPSNASLTEAQPILYLQNQGSGTGGGEDVQFYTGTSDPSGSVTADPGSLFFRDTGTGAIAYINTTTGGIPGTTWTALAAGGTTETLQDAYVAGNTITTSSTEGDFDVSGTEAISLDAGAASNFTVDSANLTLSTTTSGTLTADSAGLFDLNAGANLDIDVTGTFDMLSSGAFSIDGTGASNVTATSGTLTLSTATSGNVSISSAADIDMSTAAGCIEIDSTVANTGTVSIGADSLYFHDAGNGDLHMVTQTEYTSSVATTWGLSGIYQGSSTTTTVTTGGFTAAVAATSDATVAVTSEAGFAANDIVLVTNANDPCNNGLYEVHATAAGVLTLKSLGLNAPVTDFVKDQVVTDATVAGNVTKVSVSSLRAGTDGVFEVATFTDNTATYSDVTTAASAVTRQFFQDTMANTVTAGNPVTASDLTGASLPAKPTSNFNFDVDAEIYLNGILLMNGSGNEVSSGTGDQINLEAGGPAPTFTAGDVVTIIYYTNSTAG